MTTYRIDFPGVPAVFTDGRKIWGDPGAPIELVRYHRPPSYGEWCPDPGEELAATVGKFFDVPYGPVSPELDDSGQD